MMQVLKKPGRNDHSRTAENVLHLCSPNVSPKWRPFFLMREKSEELSQFEVSVNG